MSNKITQLMPWWLKITGKLVLARIPVAYSFWQALGLFRHGSMDTATYASQVFDNYVDCAGLNENSIAGKVIVEIGPGDSIATAMLAYAHGATAVLIDSGHWATDNLAPYKDLAGILSARGLRTPSPQKMTSLRDILQACGGKYITSGLSGWREIKDQEVDFIFSNAVLEHVRKHEFLAMQKECYRVMKQNAVAVHGIDFKDHLGGG